MKTTLLSSPHTFGLALGTFMVSIFKHGTHSAVLMAAGILWLILGELETIRKELTK